MKFKPIQIVLLASCLTACATPSLPPPALPISPSLLAPCPPHLQRPLETWGDLALEYSDLLAELRDCAARHKALSTAVQP